MKPAAKEIRTALLSSLQTNHSLANFWYGGDALPQIAMPYAKIGVITYLRDDAQAVSGADHLVSLHYYASTDESIDTYMAETVTLLDNGSLTLTGDNTAWWIKIDGNSRSVREGDESNRYSHGTQTMRIRTTDSS